MRPDSHWKDPVDTGAGYDCLGENPIGGLIRRQRGVEVAAIPIAAKEQLPFFRSKPHILVASWAVVGDLV